MAVTASVLLAAAARLLSGGNEVDYRNAASRAYYAAFHACRPVGLTLGLQEVPERGPHWDLIEIFKRQGDTKYLSIAHMLEQCRRLRVRADYEIEEDFDEARAQTTLSQCERILERVAELTRRELSAQP